MARKSPPHSPWFLGQLHLCLGCNLLNSVNDSGKPQGTHMSNGSPPDHDESVVLAALAIDFI
ncbi:MAG: hypothetical protein KTR25_03870 [Myxococcales bacterium]|nr:hypothetical protein [Myxococcales bacterium]